MEGDEGSSLLEPLPEQPSRWLTTREVINVATIRLDTSIERTFGGDSTVALLKVDAQGADLDVLASAGEFLTPGRIGAVHAEVNFRDFYKDQNAFWEVVRLLDERGYRIARIYDTTAHDGWWWMGDALLIPK